MKLLDILEKNKKDIFLIQKYETYSEKLKKGVFEYDIVQLSPINGIEKAWKNKYFQYCLLEEELISIKNNEELITILHSEENYPTLFTDLDKILSEYYYLKNGYDLTHDDVISILNSNISLGEYETLYEALISKEVKENEYSIIQIK